MFRIIKKWYFKIYHLLRFLGIFILIFGSIQVVNAEGQEYKECFDEYLIGTTTLQSVNSTQQRVRPSIIDKVTAGKTYYLRFFPETNFECSTSNGICFNEIWTWDSNNTFILGVSWNDQLGRTNFDKENQVLTFTTKENVDIKYVAPIIYSYQSNYNVLNGVKFILSDNLEDVLTCKDQAEDSVYTNFLSLYLNKMEYLAGEFTNNPYLLTMIGIIIAWIVLELFLKILHMRGGKSK